MICPRCSNEVSESSTSCPSCGTFVEFSNVRLAERPDETAALELRYREALAEADRRKALDRVRDFETAVQNQSQAVVAMDSDILIGLVRRSNTLFANYQLLVRAQARQAALVTNDQRRLAVDGAMWGNLGSEIRYAALSLDHRGLMSYGNCFATLRNLNIEHRASVLETNSYDFVQASGGGKLPSGYRSKWERRHLVAVAKCASLINGTTAASAFPEILMRSAPTRSRDEFIEVHIHGAFDFKAIEAVGAVEASDPLDKGMISIAKQYVVGAGTKWLEFS